MRTIPERYKEVVAAYTEGIRPAPLPTPPLPPPPSRPPPLRRLCRESRPVCTPTETTESSDDAPPLEVRHKKTLPPPPDDDYIIDVSTDDDILVEPWEGGSKKRDPAGN